jgi:hypothetical protein
MAEPQVNTATTLHRNGCRKSTSQVNLFRPKKYLRADPTQTLYFIAAILPW